MAKNVLGGDLQPCCHDPVTGFYRDGFCNTGPGDFGVTGGVPTGGGTATASPGEPGKVTAKSAKVTLDGEAWLQDGKTLDRLAASATKVDLRRGVAKTIELRTTAIR